ncbi:MAG TPA: AAA family ATPase [Actinomycetes bacterium]
MSRLVGREDEAARLRAFLARLADGPSALVVEGEPGIGKMALFEAVVEHAVGLRLLRARCAEAESGLAYGGGRSRSCWAVPSPDRTQWNLWVPEIRLWVLSCKSV